MSDPRGTDIPADAGRHPGWQGILDDGEQILWQGQPDAGVKFDIGSLRDMVPGLLMVAFALFWMTQAMRGGFGFAAFGLIFVFVGLRQVLKPMLWPAYLRSRSWYTLTDRRAIVATDVPFRGRRLTSYPIDANTLVQYVDGNPPSILLGPESRKRPDQPGFLYIAEAERVLPLIRRIQRGEIANQPPEQVEAGA